MFKTVMRRRVPHEYFSWALGLIFKVKTTVRLKGRPTDRYTVVSSQVQGHEDLTKLSDMDITSVTFGKMKAAESPRILNIASSI